jgi:sugar O-acyltransferase (sialic acid O-acetyltransferase NeuD family)
VIKAVALGAGGHAQVVIEALRLVGGVDLVALLSADRDSHGGDVLGVPIAGGDDQLSRLAGAGVTHAIVTAGSIGSSETRRRLFALIAGAGLTPLTVVHPAAVVAASAAIGRGTVVMAGAIVNAGARVGDNVILNTGSIVEHHCRVGNHAHLATGAQLGGAAIVGDGAHIGLGAKVLQLVEIGADAIVGAGAVVIRNVKSGATVVGVPATEKSR